MSWTKIESFLEKEVQRRVSEKMGQIKALLGAGNGRVKKAASANGETKPVPTAKRGPKNARQLHGRYLGLTRSLTKDQKAAIKNIREQRGVRAAIAEAERIRAAAEPTA